jgi:hypothetical protein
MKNLLITAAALALSIAPAMAHEVRGGEGFHGGSPGIHLRAGGEGIHLGVGMGEREHRHWGQRRLYEATPPCLPYNPQDPNWCYD